MQNFIKSNNQSIDFLEISDLLFNKTILKIKDIKFRFVEIEFYLYTQDHKDQYTYQHPDQLLYNYWSFHKYAKGNKYINSNFRGLDFSLGNKEKGIYLGILIRGVQNLNNNEFTHGPSLFVGKLLEIAECKNIEEFVDSDFKLELVDTELEKKEIYKGPRIGLKKDKYPEFWDKQYRYVIYPEKVKREKKKLIKIEEKKGEKEVN